MALERVRDGRNRGREAYRDRKAVRRQIDRRLEDPPQPKSAPRLKEEHPGIEGAGNNCWKEANPGDRIEAEFAQSLDRRGRRRSTSFVGCLACRWNGTELSMVSSSRAPVRERQSAGMADDGHETEAAGAKQGPATNEWAEVTWS